MPKLLPFNADTPIEEVHRLIDAAIEEHLASVLNLKSQRNSFVSISRLPPEVLSRIFFFAQKGLQVIWEFKDDLGEAEVPEEVKILDWITVTHVCRHWRNVALGSPTLWSEPLIGNPRWCDEMLKRSKGASLSITADFYSGSKSNITSGLQQALSRHALRIKDLSILAISSDSWTDLQDLLPKISRRLEILCLKGRFSARDFGMNGAQSSNPITIPEHVLCETERLHRLELTNCGINWDVQIHLLRSLTHLKLHNLLYNSRPTGKQFADVLEGMPNLEFLDLKNALPIETNTQASEPWPFGWHMHFASIQTLLLNSTYAELEPFFSSVTFPPNAIVKVVCCENPTLTHNADSRGAMLKALARSYSSTVARSIPFQSLVLKRPSRALDIIDGIHFRLFTDTLLEAELLLHRRLFPNLELTFACQSESILDCMVNICDAGIPLLQAVQHVHFEHFIDGLDAETIATTIGTLPLVDYVMVTFTAARPFFDALQVRVSPPRVGDAAESGDSNTAQTMSFAKLDALYLREVIFEPPKQSNQDHPIQTQAIYIHRRRPLPMKLLQDCLLERRQSSSVLEVDNIMLGFCRNVTDKDITALEQILNSVEVFSTDPDTDYYSDFDSDEPGSPEDDDIWF